MVLLQQKENELPTPPPLASVTLVFGARSIHDALVLDTTTAFLDCALELALCDAVTRQSVALLDRIWNASSRESFLSPADAGPGNGGRWSRRKYLRTDKHYNRYQFRRAVLEAAKIKDASVAMAIVQWLYAHFRGCVVPFGAVHYAAGDGKLDMLKFFKAHEVPPRADGGHKLRDEIQAKDGGHVVRWGRHDMAWASFSKQTEVVHWLHANTRAPRWIKTVLLNAAYNGDVELLEWLKENYRTHGPDLADEDADDEEEDEDDEDDEPMPLADELEDELGAALLPMNVAPEDMLLIDLRGIRGGPRMAGRVVEQMLRMGVHPLLGVDQNLLAELMGVGNAGIGAFLGPAQGQNQENNGSLTVTGNRLARAILGRGAEALEREDPDVFNRGNVDEATESGIFVEEILAAGLELNISVDLPHQNEQVRQFLTELAGAMEDDEEEDQEAGGEGPPIYRLALGQMAGGPPAARRLMDMLSTLIVAPLIAINWGMLAVDPIGAIRGAPAPRTPEELARTIPGDRLLALLTENGVEAPNDNQQVNPGGNPDHFAHSGEVIEGLLHLGIVPAISINLDELPAAIREAVLTVQAQAQEDAAAGHEAENDTPRPEEVAPPPQVRPRLWDREGDLEGENVGELLRGDPSEFMRMAIYGGQLNVMEWLFRNGYVKDCFLNVWAAIDKDHLDLLEWLIEHKLLEAGRAMEAAATRCRLDMAKHLYERYWENIRVQRYYPLTESPDRNPPRPDRDPPLWVSGDTINSAVRFGNVQLAQWLLTTFNSEIDLSDVRSARGWTGMPRPHLLDEATDSLEMVKFLHEAAAQGNIRGVGSICTTAAMDQAAARNRLDVVQWLHANRTEGCTTVAMDDAASHGHLEMVQWLHDNRSEGCTTAAMDGAAIGGHLDVVKWLHENRSEGCTTAAMDEAAANGHLDVVKWLHENRSEGCTTAAMDNAAFKHLDVVKWLSENRSEGCTTKAMDTAARFGNLEVVKWLSENRMEGCTTDAMDSAAAEGHLDVVQWLSEHRTEGCTTAAMDDAAMGWNGNFDMLLFLYSQRREGCTDAIFNGTAKPDLFTDIQESDADYTCDNIHDWLVEHYPQRAQAAGA